MFVTNVTKHKNSDRESNTRANKGKEHSKMETLKHSQIKLYKTMARHVHSYGSEIQAITNNQWEL
jgi:hypothetical protein